LRSLAPPIPGRILQDFSRNYQEIFTSQYALKWLFLAPGIQEEFLKISKLYQDSWLFLRNSSMRMYQESTRNLRNSLRISVLNLKRGGQRAE
jgi:hypothetical protein